MAVVANGKVRTRVRLERGVLEKVEMFCKRRGMNIGDFIERMVLNDSGFSSFFREGLPRPRDRKRK